jgi:hypothetical protein
MRALSVSEKKEMIPLGNQKTRAASAWLGKQGQLL